MKQTWEYLSVRFQFKGLGVTKEFMNLAVDGAKLNPIEKDVVNTLPELLAVVGNDGWELTTHIVMSDAYHLMHFKRPKDA